MVARISIGGGLFTLVDDADFAFLSQWAWNTITNRSGTRYVRRGRRINTCHDHVLMHRAIMSASDGHIVDHINGDTLDNRKGNLRLCTASQNRVNTRILDGKIRGVRKEGGGVFYAHTQHKKKTTRRGPFATEIEAARAYDEMVFAIHGDFAMLNFPKECRA